MAENILVGEWFTELEKAPAVKEMVGRKNGKIYLNPFGSAYRGKWAKAIKTRLNKDGFENVEIV